MQCGRFGSDPPFVAVLTKCSVAVLVVILPLWPFWPNAVWPFWLWSSLCGRFDQYNVAVLVVAVLVAKNVVAVLGVAVLECGRFDQDPYNLSKMYMVFVLNQNKKGLWLLNKKCVIIDQFSHWSQQVYRSYSETCQVFVYPLIWSEPTGSQGELLIRSISYCCTQWRNSRKALCLPTVEIGIYVLFCPWKGYSVCHSGNKLSKRQLWLWNRFW